MERIDPPGHTIPMAALKNYIRRMMVESDVSCPFRFSLVDDGSCIQTYLDGTNEIVIGLKTVYEHSVVKPILFKKDVFQGIDEAVIAKSIGSGLNINFEKVDRSLSCRFVREDDAVWTIRACKHELQHLHQRVKLFREISGYNRSGIARMCVDDMLAGVIPEYYVGAYHVMAHELNAEFNGVVGSVSDLASHSIDLGLSPSRAEELLLDRIEREPQWYGELYF